MTAIQILSRRTPKIDDFKGQIIETLKNNPIPDPVLNERFFTLLMACIQYEPQVDLNKLRPTAEVVSNEVINVLEAVGGDFRDHEERIQSLEVIAQKKESERLKSISSRSGSIYFRPNNNAHSASSAAASGSLSRKNSATSVLGVLSNEHIGKTGSLDNILFGGGGSSPASPMMGLRTGFSTSSYKNDDLTSVNMMSVMSASFASQDNEDKLSMVRYFANNLRIPGIESTLVADMLVKNGVANIEILKRRLLRNDEFLLDLGVEESTNDIILQELVNVGGRRAGEGSEKGSSVGGSVAGSISVVSKGSGKSGGSHSSSFISSPSAALSHKGRRVNGDVLPTEISRLYYEAAQLNMREALDKLQGYANDKGDKLAECYLMRMYALGQGGLTKDTVKAQEMGNRLLPWLKETMENLPSSDLCAMYIHYLIGICYAEGLGTTQDHREGVRWCRQAAEVGYATAQAYVGYCFFAGLGLPRNLEEAVYWYRLGADQGYAPAQCNLGLCYEHGYGVPRSYELAVKWYGIAAEQGDAAALYNLGFCHEKGIGVEEDMKEAVRYYKCSAGYGYTSAEYSLGVSYYFGYGVEQNMEEAVAWYQIAAEKGYSPAQCNLGLCYENGHGIEKDYIEAVYWYRQAANQSHPASLYYLGFCYFSGMGVERSIEEAVKYYKLSGERKYAPALNNLGFCYFNGMGVAKDYKIAVRYYRESAELGYAAAQYNMGYCYEKGFGVVTKLQHVLQWYKVAADNGNEKAKKALIRLQE
jgi:TPR repeat protein